MSSTEAPPTSPGNDAPSTTDDDPAPTPPPRRPSLLDRSASDRLALAFPNRLILALTISAACGFGLGAAHGGIMAGLRFRAENAHRLPTTQAGWFFYHRSKNYNAMLGGIKHGVRMAPRLMFGAGMFFMIEESMDRLRGGALKKWVEFEKQRRASRGWEKDLGVDKVDFYAGHLWVQRDFLSTAVAAVSTAGAYSAYHRLPLPTTAGMVKLGLKAGIAYGLVQDALGLLRGRRIGYVDFIMRHLGVAPKQAVAEVTNT